MVGKREDTAGEHQRPPDSSALAKLISARQKKTLGFAAVQSGRNSVDGRRVEKVDGNLAIVLQYIFYTCTHIRYDRCLFPSSAISTIHSRMQATEVIAILLPIYQGYNAGTQVTGRTGLSLKSQHRAPRNMLADAGGTSSFIEHGAQSTNVLKHYLT